jgi:hypothetical protein
MSRARELADLSNVINKGANLQPNLAFNGDMSVWQRGTSDDTATAGDYMCDRWRINHAGTDGNVDWDQETASTPDGFGYALKVSMDASETSLDAADFVIVQQFFEGQDLQHLNKGSASAKKLTVSFWVRSSVASTYTVELKDGDNTRNISKSYSISTADTWEKKVIVFDGDTTGAFDNDNALSLQLSFWLDAGSNFTSGTFSTDWIAQDNTRRVYDTTGWLESTSPEFYITGVSLVVGDSAPVTHPYESYAENLERCNRYYYSLKAIASYSNFLQAAWRTTSQARGIIPFPVTMRASPSLSTTGAFVSLGNGTFSSFSIPDGGLKDQGTLNVVGSGGTIGYSTTIRANNDSTASINFDAEL